MKSVRSWVCSLAASGLLLAGSATLRAADNPALEEAQYNVVVTLYNAGQWQKAVEKIEEREKLTLPDPMRSKYLFAKGLAYEKGEKGDLARETYKRLIEKFPAAAEVEPAKVSLLYLDYAAGKSDDVLAGYAQLDQG